MATASVTLAQQGSNNPSAGYMQKLRDLSFDMSVMHEYPTTWTTQGSAVPILSKVKVVPAIPKVNGQLFMKDQLKTPAWDVSYRLVLNQSQ